ncbi:gamma-glutamyl-gamma-aminobutyrate hydrolase PuuD [Dyella sp. SG562]|uniref:gamma-glutamyl-gamma-aminobutyrate hydrolase family protein n=1 Tax=Dyella sp. SG562 TaxID=2587017 RepID=UPI001421D813|nr:gamma-glutamyl-gamma-aminobutyrate hydrolase family protein [Dyella sp. SG562]NII75069.1 gamma-glutamyl-gamma-aminobutyrate hydrolase PuuD [Dyella sp. SG562]
MAHRKYDNPRRGTLGFVRTRPLRPPTRQDVLALGGIVAGPYGTPGYEHAKPGPPMLLRPESGRKARSAEVSGQLTAANPIKRQPITITHREDAFGAGAFWDHYTTRSTTGRQTDISHHRKVTATLEASGVRNRGQYTGALPGRRPSRTTGPGSGLLLITGGNYGLESETPRNRDHVAADGALKRHGRRVRHEADLLKQAQLTGRPVLGICGGSWRVLESYGGSTRGVKPKTHQTKKMPYLTTKGVVARVASTHGLDVTPGSMLSGAFRDDQQATPSQVNTAHWAVAEEASPGHLKGVPTIGRNKQPLLTISARGGTRNDPPYLKKTEKVPDRSVEAFETRHGAPVMGIQWHPEAYGTGFEASHTQANRRLLDWMAQAGDAYEARRGMTQQFKAALDPRRSLPPRMQDNRALAVARRNAQRGLHHGEEAAIEARHDLADEFSRRVGARRLTPRYLVGNQALQLVRRNAKL